MSFRTTGKFLKNEYAMLGQPFRLAIVIIITAVIILLFYISLQSLIAGSDHHQIEQQLQKILLEASAMFEHADEGSYITLQVTFPKSLRFLVFGHLPNNNTLEPVNTTLNENTSNNGYYLMTDGTMCSFHSQARFSDSTMTHIAVFYPGSYTIILELRKQGGKIYVTLS